jgi:hypothetical protein
VEMANAASGAAGGQARVIAAAGDAELGVLSEFFVG